MGGSRIFLYVYFFFAFGLNGVPFKKLMGRKKQVVCVPVSVYVCLLLFLFCFKCFSRGGYCSISAAAVVGRAYVSPTFTIKKLYVRLS